MKRPPEQAVLTATFPLSGVVTTMLGPLLPALVARWLLTDAQAGQLFLAQFLASTSGAICSAWIVARAGIPRSVGGAYALMGTAVLILNLVPRSAGLLVIACYGFMLGVSIPAVNVAASLRSPGREMAQLNLLNTAWCLGAVLAPPAIVSLLRSAGMGAVLALIGALCLLSGTACLLFLKPTIVRHAAAGERPKIGKTIRRAAVATGLFLFLYVGVENGLNGWMPLLAQRTHAGTNTGAAALSVFWAAILLSRLMAGLFSGHLESRMWLRSGLVLATLGVAAVIAFPHMPALFLLGSAAAGLGMGPLFPTAVAVFHAGAGAVSERLMGLVFAASGCGGGALPWLIGLISSATGSLQIGLALALAALATMILMQFRADRTTGLRRSKP